MDNIHKQQIKELRLSGLGYKKIAKITSVSLSNVKYYCKTNNLAGYGEQLKISYEEPGEKRLYCKQCGRKIIRNKYSGKKLFCTETCRRLWWKENGKEATRARYEIKCKYCGKRFVYYSSNHNRKFCSRDCYIKDRFWKDMSLGFDRTTIQLNNCCLRKIT